MNSRVSAQGSYYRARVGLLAEHVLSSQRVRRDLVTDSVGHAAWQVAGSYVLSGERASSRGVAPRRDFDPRGTGWGAFELATRYAALSIDRDTFPVFANPNASAREARAWAVGLNWYMNRGVKFVVNYEQTHFTGGAGDGDRPIERDLFTRLQIAF